MNIFLEIKKQQMKHIIKKICSAINLQEKNRSFYKYNFDANLIKHKYL